ncbi:hypothetical protein [Nocardia flavorosea]|uniref:Uncharacterized protein n=1 Tax=Nocardia flavorosea TaxID=53429 RepID=A0A846YTR9_9NOCA|nr:hypothetical protein [Nocardia flavorosea]NKY60369.1 hypothetical protein [Nocardia flavorosea]
MRFRLKMGPFELEIQMPEPVQISPTDLVTALWSAMSQDMMPHMLCPEEEADEP